MPESQEIHKNILGALREDLTPSSKLLKIFLLLNKGTAEIDMDSLSTYLGVARMSTYAAIKQLEKKGMLLVDRTGSTNRYTLV